MQNSNTPSHQIDLLHELFGEISTREEEPKEESPWLILYLEPMATPRPRSRSIRVWKNGEPSNTSQVYNPTKYTRWKEGLALMVKRLDLVPDEYNSLDLILGIPLKKSYTKKEKERLCWKLHDKTPDFDNYVKGVLDAIQDSGKIKNDSKFGSGMIEKVWIPEKEKAFICFRVEIIKKSRFDVQGIIDKMKS